MLREFSVNDFDELLRLRCLLYTSHSELELHDELTAFIYSPHNNPFRKYALWTSFVYQRENGGLGGFIDVGFIYADEYKERLDHFTDTEYYARIALMLSSGRPIPVVESWYVDEDMRRKRIGTQLLRQAEQWVSNAGCPFILSDTDDFREISKKAHASLGYATYHTDANGCHYFYKPLA